jgi:SAM-dependent methyltransferase
VPRITEAFRTGAGMGWHEHDADVFVGCEQFFRPGYIANLIPSWIPALDGVADKLRAGAKVADIGCGLGASTILLAQAYPNSVFSGSDYHDQSIELARKRAGDAGVADRLTFEVAPASSFSGTGYDLAAAAGQPARRPATTHCHHDHMNHTAAARSHPSKGIRHDYPARIRSPLPVRARACTRIIGVVSLAIPREDKHLTLTGEATSDMPRAERWSNGVGRSRSAPLGAAF